MGENKKMDKAIVSIALIIVVFLVGRKILLAKTDEIPATLITKIIAAESQFNPRAVGKAGERGLFQLREATWDWLTEKMYNKKLHFDLAFDSTINKEVGIYYLKWIKNYLGSHYTPGLLVGCFNYGPSRIKTLGYSLPDSAWDHPNLIYRQIFREELEMERKKGGAV